MIYRCKLKECSQKIQSAAVKGRGENRESMGAQFSYIALPKTTVSPFSLQQNNLSMLFGDSAENMFSKCRGIGRSTLLPYSSNEKCKGNSLMYRGILRQLLERTRNPLRLSFCGCNSSLSRDSSSPWFQRCPE